MTKILVWILFDKSILKKKKKKKKKAPDMFFLQICKKKYILTTSLDVYLRLYISSVLL